jgi:hypothetical protein
MEEIIIVEEKAFSGRKKKAGMVRTDLRERQLPVEMRVRILLVALPIFSPRPVSVVEVQFRWRNGSIPDEDRGELLSKRV